MVSVAGDASVLSDVHAWRCAYAPDLIGESRLFLKVLDIVRRIAATDCDVLLQGKSGTGKELIARVLHQASGRSHKPFVAINCAAIPKELLETELFGHARGAFTGAFEKKQGTFQTADGGTLFLDEVGELELSLQGKLLRVIQEREVIPVGDTKPQRVNVRIVSATNHPLDVLCQEKKFREDLFYRLNVVPITLPLLSERAEDIPVLAQYFIEKANRVYHRHIPGVLPEALECLKTYPWPGNVRELQHAMTRLVILKPSDTVVGLEDVMSVLPRSVLEKEWDISLPSGGLHIDALVEKITRQLTLDALKRSGGNKAKAAELLGLKRTTLVERLKKLSLNQF
jgi:two-component system response regulator AtoC